MANSNIAVAVNNIIFGATAPMLPNKEVLDKINVKDFNVAIVVDDIKSTINRLNETSPILVDYIGELDFFNEVTGLAEYVSMHGYAYDYRDDASSRDYPSTSLVLCMPKLNMVNNVDIIIDATEMNVYRVYRR